MDFNNIEVIKVAGVTGFKRMKELFNNCSKNRQGFIGGIINFGASSFF